MNQEAKQSSLTPEEIVDRLLKELEKAVHIVLGSGMKGVTKDDLRRTERNIMSAISDFAAAQSAFNAREKQDIATIQTAIQALNDKITALQNSPGSITPQDQALLDGIQKDSSALADQLDALAAAQPPVPPITPPVTPAPVSNA